MTVAPEITDVELGIADLYYKKKHYDLSMDYLRRIISNVPESYRAYILLGHCLLATGSHEDAASNYRKALALNPNSLPARYYLAVAKETGGDDQAAVQLYQSLLEEKPDLADAGLRLARLLIKKNRIDEAIAYFSALAEKLPENGYLNFILGEIYYSAHDFEKATSNYTLALKKNPNLVAAYQKIVEMEPDPEKKIAIVGDAIEKTPQSVDLKMTLAGLHYMVNDLDSAISVMEELHIKQPKSPLIANNLAWLYLEGDVKHPKAYELSQFAYEADPSNPNYAHTFGWACYKKGFLKKADWHLREVHRFA